VASCERQSWNSASREEISIVPTPTIHPTPYPDVNDALAALLSGAQSILGKQLVGVYLFGSLATGDFHPHSSDLDVLIVSDAALSDEQFAALAALHERFAESASPWATEIEVSYIPRDDLRLYDPARKLYPRIDRGSGLLGLRSHDIDWVIQRHVLREHGIAVTGPALAELIDAVSPDELRRAEVELIRIWWGPMNADPAKLQRRGYQVYCVLTMCRVLYMLEYGTVVSKPTAAAWARRTQDARWSPLIERALSWRKDQQEVVGDDVAETQALIRHTLARCDAMQ
jgi:predicted nucleotidyltransferase